MRSSRPWPSSSSNRPSPISPASNSTNCVAPFCDDFLAAVDLIAPRFRCPPESAAPGGTYRGKAECLLGAIHVHSPTATRSRRSLLDRELSLEVALSLGCSPGPAHPNSAYAGRPHTQTVRQSRSSLLSSKRPRSLTRAGSLSCPSRRRREGSPLGFAPAPAISASPDFTMANARKRRGGHQVCEQLCTRDAFSHSLRLAHSAHYGVPLFSGRVYQ